MMARPSAAAVAAAASNGTPGGGGAGGAGSGGVSLNNFTYSSALTAPASTLQELTLRQLQEDISAYKYDLDFCNHQLTEADLSPPETRTFQIRVFDLGHQIRHSQHRIEVIQFEMTSSASRMAAGLNGYANGGGHAAMGIRDPHGHPHHPHQLGMADLGGGAGGGMRGTKALPVKRVTGELEMAAVAAAASAGSPVGVLKKRRTGVGMQQQQVQQVQQQLQQQQQQLQQQLPMQDESDEANMAVQRLGHWKCRLCTSEKYLSAGPGRQPGAPCKWPLRDVAKMIAHFMELHTEHTPAERCEELGHALDRNRGPFEYWLRRSHSLDVGNGAVIEQCIQNLQGGRLPAVLRKLSRAASSFPEEWE